MNITIGDTETLTINEGWTLSIIGGVPVIRKSEQDHDVMAWRFDKNYYTTNAMVLKLVDIGMADIYDAENVADLKDKRLIDEAIGALVVWTQDRQNAGNADRLNRALYPQQIFRWEMSLYEMEPLEDASGKRADWNMQ